MTGRVLVLLLGLVGAMTAALLVAPSPASADDELGLSSDGVTWTSGSLTDPLFDPDVRWVPGDTRTARFFVRNQALTTGNLDVDLLRAGRRELLQSGELEISARAGDGPWTTIEAGGSLALVDQVEARSGAVVPVDLRVAMDFSAPNGTMLLATDLDLRVRLSQDRAVVLPESGDGDGDGDGGGDFSTGPGGSTSDDGSTGATGGADGNTGGGLLPATGSTLTWWLALLTLLLLGGGSFLLTLRRPTESDDFREARP